MNNVSTFNFNTNSLRVIELDGSPWFVAADVCRVLGIVNTSTAVKPLESSEWSRANLGQRGLGAVLTVTESGLYKLIMRSDKPEAKAFQNWVTQVVLPAIRKDGAYVMGEEKVATGEMDEDELVLRAHQILMNKVERLRAERDAAQAKVIELEHEVTHLTLNEYQTTLGRYLSPSQRGKMARIAASYCASKGLTVTTKQMAYTHPRNGETYVSPIKVYPLEALEEAALLVLL